MSLAIGIFFLICVLFSILGRNSEESAAIKGQTKELPVGAQVFFDKEISGYSKKRVVTYYKHFVSAVCTDRDGCIKQQTFPFNEYELSEKAAAWGKAHDWVIDSHIKIVSKVVLSSPISNEVCEKNTPILITNPNLVSSNFHSGKDRYGRDKVRKASVSSADQAEK